MPSITDKLCYATIKEFIISRELAGKVTGKNKAKDYSEHSMITYICQVEDPSRLQALNHDGRTIPSLSQALPVRIQTRPPTISSPKQSCWGLFVAI